MFVETTFCVDLLREARRGGGPATEKLASLGDTELLVSIFVLCELDAGARLSASPEREQAKVAGLIRRLRLILPDAAFPAAYGAAEAATRLQGSPVPAMDLLIGATAMQHDRPLITRDTGHYGRIPGLKVETY